MNKRCIYCQSISDVGMGDIDCPVCGMANKLTPFVNVAMLQATSCRAFDSYESPATGRVITSHTARKYDMQASGCREWEGAEQEKKHAAKVKAQEEQEFDNKLTNWVGEAYQQLPPDKKAVLENAID